MNNVIGGVDKPTFCDAGLYWDKSKFKKLILSISLKFYLEHGCQWPKDVPHCKRVNLIFS